MTGAQQAARAYGERIHRDTQQWRARSGTVGDDPSRDVAECRERDLGDECIELKLISLDGAHQREVRGGRPSHDEDVIIVTRHGGAKLIAASTERRREQQRSCRRVLGRERLEPTTRKRRERVHGREVAGVGSAAHIYVPGLIHCNAGGGVIASAAEVCGEHERGATWIEHRHERIQNAPSASASWSKPIA